MSTWAAILAGGVGSRFWPLSEPRRPKQLLPLASDQPLLVDAIDRLRPLVDASQMLILTNTSLIESIAALDTGIPQANLIGEPRAAGTGGALAWAASEIERRDGPEAVMVSVHADWAVTDPEAFRAALQRAMAAATAQHLLVTVGIVPSRPEIGYGYILPGEVVAGDCRRVARFVEKPDRARAEVMVKEGYLWNSGIFAWRVGDFLAQVRRVTPEIAPALEAHAGDLPGFFAALTPITIDVGVLERTRDVLVIPGDFGWDDVGGWGALGRVRRLDAQGNGSYGPTFAVEATDNVVHTTGRPVVAYGVENLVIVALDDIVLVTTTERSAELKSLLDRLPPSIRERS